MNARHSLLLLAMMALSACQSSDPRGKDQASPSDSLAWHSAWRSRIDSLEKVLSADSLGISPQTAPLDSLAATCLRFAETFPSDPYAPTMMWKAARVMRTMGNSEGAVRCGKAIADGYPAHPLAPIALYFNAVVLNEDMGVREAALFYLDRLQEEYPSDSLVRDAALYRETMGYSQEDWNKRLQERP
ncbi:MAG: tetratricopeptide repeat protein [Bacteroidota bacterium]